VDAERALFANQVADLRVVKGVLVLGALSVVAVTAATRAFGRAVAIELSPVHPSPREETARLLFPSVRFCIVLSSW
jgi:hypothetical protein